jgi:proton-translocating NADH-quinone oxidoreductase chain N
VVILTAMPYLTGRTPYRGEFYALLLVVGAAICLATSATNLVMIYLGMEFLSITSYVLAGFLRNDQKSGEAALKYFLYGATASAVMLYGMSLLYGATGTTDLAGIAAAFRGKAQGELVWLGVPALILLLAGFGFKASLVPFHQWAPDTYEGAPTPVTAFLSTASKAAGFAILMRVFLVALAPLQSEWIALLIAVSVLTMTVGNLTALRQTNVKRLLAYSSIAQAGYILIGVAAVVGAGVGASPAPTFNGINGVLIYLFAYLFTNVGAFAVVTAIETATGKVELKDYAGLIRRSPWLAGLLLIFLLSLAGIPPTGGFLGKFYVFGAAVQRQMWGLLAIAAVNSVVAAFYYLNVVRYMFFAPAEADAGPIRVAWPLQVSLGITAVLTLLLGLAPGPLIAWAAKSVQLFALR